MEERLTLLQARALQVTPVPQVVRRFGRFFAFGLGVFIVCSLLLPFQQTAHVTGRVVAFSPTEREQAVHAPISGRIVRWYVNEGTRVEANQPLVELLDVDPNYVERLLQRKVLDEERIAASSERAQMYEEQASAYNRARTMMVRSVEMKVAMAEQRIAAANQKRDAAAALAKAAELNLERTRKLHEKGLASERQLELAELGAAQAQSELELTRALVLEEQANRTSLLAEVPRVDAEGRAQVATAEAESRKAQAEAASAERDLTSVTSDLSRQESRTVLAPKSGIVVRINGNQGGGIVHSGEQLALLIPETSSRVVEVYAEGNDAPLISPGRKVRLQFEGWPAVQFAGWPSVAVGTFGGEVKFVDPVSIDGKGRVRLLIQPDPSEPEWPNARHLRQNVRAKGWVLLDRVSTGWELWRRLNGFPATISGEPSAARKDDGEAPKSRIEKGTTK
jgi:membrane fusion protein, adhesin transport system